MKLKIKDLIRLTHTHTHTHTHTYIYIYIYDFPDRRFYFASESRNTICQPLRLSIFFHLFWLIIDWKIIKVKVKLLAFVSDSINEAREIFSTQQEVENLIDSWETIEQTGIQPPFVEKKNPKKKTGEEPNCALYITLPTPGKILIQHCILMWLSITLSFDHKAYNHLSLWLLQYNSILNTIHNSF